MPEEAVVAFAKVVQSRFSRSGMSETILGTFPVASEEVVTLPALRGQFVLLVQPELLLPGAVHHLGQGLLTDIAQLIGRKDEMITTVQISIELHRSRMSAIACQRANTRLFAYPVG